MFKIGWFSTGRGQGSLNLLHAIMQAVRSGAVPAELACVFCSREPGDAAGSDRYIEQVRSYGIPLVCFSSKRFMPELRAAARRDPAAMAAWRQAYDREVMQRLDAYRADVHVLAGYMLVLGPEMCRGYDMINLHPALPDGPAGTWQEVIWQLIRTRATHSGNMMHLVTEQLDQGPPITYARFSLHGPAFDPLWQALDRDGVTREDETLPLFQQIRATGVRYEIPLVVETVAAFARGDIALRDGRVMAGGRQLAGPYDLSAAIEAGFTS